MTMTRDQIHLAAFWTLYWVAIIAVCVLAYRAVT